MDSLIADRLDWEHFRSEEGEIPLVDRSFAEMLLQQTDHKTQALAVFLATLCAASRSGNLYLQVAPVLKPSVEELFGPINAGLLFEELILQGAAEAVLSGCLPIVEKDGRFYLQRLFLAEKECFEQWERLRSAPPDVAVDAKKLANELQVLQTLGLTAEQRHAVEMSCRSSLFLLMGGPGTGKTFTAGHILNTLLKCINASSSFEIALAAPTGKAVQNLNKAIAPILEKAGFTFKAETLHSLLGISQDKLHQDEVPALPYDLYLIDECSMIDVELMRVFLASVKSGARVILLGDPFQLPPVESGAIFTELSERHSEKVRLTVCQRVERIELITLAESLRQTGLLQLETRQSQSVAGQLQFEFGQEQREAAGSAFKVYPTTCSLEQLLEEQLPMFMVSVHLPPEELLEAFNRFRILSPKRAGKGGVEMINRWIYQRLNKHDIFAVPLMIAANDYDLQLFNGETAVLITKGRRLLRNYTRDDRVYLSGGRSLPAQALPKHELAYAMTVHKSQGSEYDEVLLVLPQGIQAVAPSLLYTAVTRAKKRIALWKNQ